jgi:hypothetical protein
MKTDNIIALLVDFGDAVEWVEPIWMDEDGALVLTKEQKFVEVGPYDVKDELII